MTIERDAELAALKEKIPQQFDPENNPQNLRAEFEASHDGAVNAVHVADKALNTHLHQLGVNELADGDMDSSLSSGYRALGSHMAGGASGKSEQRKKEKDAANLRRFLILQAQLDRLYEDIAAIDRQLDKNNQALESINEIYELTAAGTFDPEQNSEHTKLLEHAGITLDEHKENSQNALANRFDELNVENDRLTRERQERVNEIRDFERSDPEAAQAYYEKKGLRGQNVEARLEQIDLQQHESVNNVEELTEDRQNRNTAMSVDEEVGVFMKEFSKMQLIEDDLVRLAREQELVEQLSNGAMETVSWEENTEKLFEENYFDAMKEGHNQTSESEAVITVTNGPSTSI